MKPECDAITPLLGAYADSELDAAKAGQVKQHLATCADCRRHLAQIEQLSELTKSVPHPELAEDYWYWHQHRVWRRINQDRRGLAKPLRRPLLSSWSISTAVGLVVVAVVVIGGWRMMGQGGLGDISRYLMMEKTAGKQPEAVAAQPKLAGDGARVDKAGSEAVRTADEIETANAAERPGKGAAEVSGGGSSGGLGAASREPAVATLQDRGKEAAATGYADKEELAEKTSQQHAKAVGQPVRSGAAGMAAPVPAPPATAGKQSPVPYVQTASTKVAPGLVSAPALPLVDAADTGTAVLGLSTDSLGFVTRAVVTHSSGRALNDSIAVLNARASRFKPVLVNGRPLGSVFQRQYRFMAAQKSDPPQDAPQDTPAPSRPGARRK